MASNIPDGWTDDMSVRVGSGKSVEDLAKFLLQTLLARTHYEEAIRSSIAQFSLSEDDADLAYDRAQGGVVRALTGNPANRPDPVKDPVGYYAFRQVWATLPRAHRFSRRRKAQGVWSDWYDSRRT